MSFLLAIQSLFQCLFPLSVSFIYPDAFAYGDVCNSCYAHLISLDFDLAIADFMREHFPESVQE